MKAQEYTAAYQKAREDLLQDGYQERKAVITSGKAMGLGLLFSLPFVAGLGMYYRFFLIQRAHLSETSGLAFYGIFLAITVLSVVCHELLHGLGWAVASGKGWHVVRFNVSVMMPSCACKIPLEKGQYLVGVLAPLAVLGLGSVLFLLIYPGTVSVLTMIVNFVAAGADLVIACRLLKEKNALIMDHPTEAGYIAFYR